VVSIYQKKGKRRGGIRALARLYGPLSYTIRIAALAKVAKLPVNPCTLLHAGTALAATQSVLGLPAPRTWISSLRFAPLRTAIISSKSLVKNSKESGWAFRPLRTDFERFWRADFTRFFTRSTQMAKARKEARIVANPRRPGSLVFSWPFAAWKAHLPAWEVGSRLNIQNLDSTALISDDRNYRVFKNVPSILYQWSRNGAGRL